MSKTVLTEVIENERYESEDGQFTFERSYGVDMVDEDGELVTTDGQWVFRNGGEAFAIEWLRITLADRFGFELEPR